MLSELFSVTNLQCQLQKITYPKKSGSLDQIREELWELHDKETVEIVRRSRNGESSHSIQFVQ